MKEEKNHVGRPTNEEVAERKKEKLNKILTPILVVAIVLVGGFIAIMNLSSNRATNLEGSSNGVSHNGNLDVSAKNSQVVLNGCNITIPFMFESDTSKEIVIDKIMLKDDKDTQTFWVQQLNKKLSARTKTTQNITIPVSGFPTSSQNSGKSTVYFKVIWHYSNNSSKLYYKGESYKYREKLTDNTITLCRTNKASITTTTTKAASTASKFGNDINVSARNSKVNSGNCKITVPIDIKNDQSKELVIDYIELKTSTNKILKKFTVNKTLSRNQKYTANTTWDINTFPTLKENNNSKNVTFGVIYHFVGSSQKYWKTELYNYYSEIKDSDITTCRNIAAKKTTTTKKAQVTVKFYINKNSTDATFKTKTYKVGEKGVFLSEEDFIQNNNRYLKGKDYYLAGWAWKRDASNKDYNVKNGVSDQWIKDHNGKTVILYAVWKKNTTTTKKATATTKKAAATTKKAAATTKKAATTTKKVAATTKAASQSGYATSCSVSASNDRCKAKNGAGISANITVKCNGKVDSIGIKYYYPGASSKLCIANTPNNAAVSNVKVNSDSRKFGLTGCGVNTVKYKYEVVANGKTIHSYGNTWSSYNYTLWNGQNNSCNY